MARKNEIRWMVRLRPEPGSASKVPSLAEQMTAVVRDREPRTLQYDWFRDAATGHVETMEAFEDSEAALAHLKEQTDSGLLHELLTCCTPERFEVFGRPSEELKAALKAWDPTYMEMMPGLDDDAPERGGPPRRSPPGPERPSSPF